MHALSRVKINLDKNILNLRVLCHNLFAFIGTEWLSRFYTLLLIVITKLLISVNIGTPDTNIQVEFVAISSIETCFSFIFNAFVCS